MGSSQTAPRGRQTDAATPRTIRKRPWSWLRSESSRWVARILRQLPSPSRFALLMAKIAFTTNLTSKMVTLKNKNRSPWDFRFDEHSDLLELWPHHTSNQQLHLSRIPNSREIPPSAGWMNDLYFSFTLQLVHPLHIGSSLHH